LNQSLIRRRLHIIVRQEMNKRKLARGIAYGAMMGLMLFNLMRPKNERIFVSPDEKGSLSRTISERNYTAVVTNSDHRFFQIYYKPKRDSRDYLLPLAIGVAFGIATYRNPSENSKNQLINADQRIATEHTKYPEFVREDSDRALFSGDELVAVFASWLKRQPPTDSNTNTIEQAGNSDAEQAV